MSSRAAKCVCCGKEPSLPYEVSFSSATDFRSLRRDVTGFVNITKIRFYNGIAYAWLCSGCTKRAYELELGFIEGNNPEKSPRNFKAQKEDEDLTARFEALLRKTDKK